MNFNKEQIEVLTDLGFNNLEAEIYLTMLKESDLTGYRIAKILGKQRSNIYKAIESLLQKGAILVNEQNNSNMYSAIPITSYITLLEKDLKKKKESAETVLKDITSDLSSDGIYKLTTIDQVFEQAKIMIREAKDVILVDAFPQNYKRVKKYLEEEKNCKDELDIFVKIYETDNSKEFSTKCRLTFAPDTEQQMESWDGQWLIISVDTLTSLIACISHDGKKLYQGLWTRNPFFSGVIYNGLYSEITMTEAITLLKKNDKPDNILTNHRSFKRISEIQYKNQNLILKKYNNLNER